MKNSTTDEHGSFSSSSSIRVNPRKSAVALLFGLKNPRLSCFALSRAMTRPAFRAAVARFGQFAVRADAGLRVHTPEQAVVGRRHGGVMFCLDELAFPAQCRADVLTVDVEASGVGHEHHAAPPELWPAA